MKSLFVSILLASCVITKAQSFDDNTPVKNANTLPAFDSSHDKIGQIVVIEGLRSGLFLKSCSQKMDSNGIYISQFVFCNPNHVRLRGVTLVLQFNKMVDTAYSEVEGTAINIHTTFGGHSGSSFQATELAPGAIITYKVISKKKVFTSITGVDAQLH
jgi:hypothetical protein